MNRLRAYALSITCILALAAPALAADQPISATRLEMRVAGNGKQKLVFQTKDPAFVVPVPAGTDDPTVGNPGGLVIEIFSETQGHGSIVASKDAGDPGWSSRLRPVASYKYLDRRPPPGAVRSVILRGGPTKTTKIDAVGVPIALGQQGRVAVRITVGSLRSCALFDAATIHKQQSNVFRATNAVASSLTDCSDVSMLQPSCGSVASPQCAGACPNGSVCAVTDLLGACTCISATQPCGGTAFACNGECPAGEACFTTGIGQCSCLPAGSTACSVDTCGGDCPAGKECNSVHLPGVPSYCECGQPGPCGSGGDDCPDGSFCGQLNGQPTCLPFGQRRFCGDGPVTPACSHFLPTQAACEQEGGCWDYSPIHPGICNCPTLDGGTSCDSYDDCEGFCVASDCVQSTARCSDMRIVFGCLCLAEGTSGVNYICID